MALPASLRARTLESSLAIYGDSTAFGTGATAPADRWYNIVDNDFAPVPALSANGVGGENSTQMLARIVADTAHATWIHICMDVPNTGEAASTWLANMTSALALQPRTLIVVPCLAAPECGPDGSAAAIEAIQAQLPTLFPSNAFDAATQAAYLAAIAQPGTRIGDCRHFSDAGQAIQAQYITGFLAANNWLPGRSLV